MKARIGFLFSAFLLGACYSEEDNLSNIQSEANLVVDDVTSVPAVLRMFELRTKGCQPWLSGAEKYCDMYGYYPQINGVTLESSTEIDYLVLLDEKSRRVLALSVEENGRPLFMWRAVENYVGFLSPEHDFDQKAYNAVFGSMSKR